MSGYCDKSAKEKVEKMIDVDTKVAQKSSCSIMLSISRVVFQLVARAAAPPPHVHYEKKLTKNIRPTDILQIYTSI